MSLYVYAFVSEPLEPGRIAGHRIETVPTAGIHVVVERLDTPPRLSEESLRDQHEIVTKLSRMVDAVLPARFGGFLQPVELARIVRLKRARLRSALRQVTGRVQMTMRIVESGRREEQRQSVGKGGPGTRYLQDRRTAAAVRTTALVNRIRAILDSLIVDERVETASARTTIFHLIARTDTRRYRARLADMATELGPAFTVTVTGPWPPFAFAPDL